jgi:hypothetical protein
MFTRRKIGGHNGNTGGDDRTPFQMGAWVSLYEISRVRSRDVLSCDYSGIREAGRQAAARQARNKRTPGSAASVHYHRSRVPHRLAGPILGG